MPSAMILAAGLGTRLRPLSLELPKPLFWVGDRRVLAYIAGQLKAAGIGEAVINTHYLADAFDEGVLAELPLGLRVLFEAEILGTSGGVANALGCLGEGDIVVWNGDIVADLDVGALLSAHQQNEGREATLVVAKREAGTGTVGLDRCGDVVRLRGECFGDEAAGGDFLGIQVLGTGLRGRLAKPGCLVGDVYLPALRERMRIGTFVFEKDWLDIGTPQSYWEANMRWLGRQSCSSEGYWGPDVACSKDVRVERCVIGRGAQLQGRGSLRECVVWPGAKVVAPLERAIVTAGGSVLRL